MVKNYFSIGKLSKLSGVHIQSLRYYDEIGILKPAFVDPDTSYRYYTFQHMRIVEAIQYCVDLGIPLKYFTDFIKEQDGEIDFAKLIDFGTRLTKQKMLQIQERLQYLENIQKEIARSKEFLENEKSESYLPERICWAMEYEGLHFGSKFQTAFYNMVTEIERNGLKAGYDSGLLKFHGQNEDKSYIFINIRSTNKNLNDFSQVIRIPSGNYISAVSTESRIAQAPEIFKEQFQQDYAKIIVEVEMFVDKYHYHNPMYELRCSLPTV